MISWWVYEPFTGKARKLLFAHAQENLIAILIVAGIGDFVRRGFRPIWECCLMYPVQPADRLAYILATTRENDSLPSRRSNKPYFNLSSYF